MKIGKSRKSQTFMCRTNHDRDRVYAIELNHAEISSIRSIQRFVPRFRYIRLVRHALTGLFLQ